VSGSVDASPRPPAPEAYPSQAPSTAPPVAQDPAGPSVDVRPLDVPLVRLDPALPLPSYARPGDAGVDLACTEDVVLAPGERRLVGTGIALALPPGHAGFVHPRSGLAARTGLSIVNAPGTVDAGYRGEVRVCLINLGRDEVTLRRGDRIAQLVVQRVEQVRFVEVAALPGSERGAGGHGSTGGHAALGEPS
jgi:dUTP pyrophosphatase